MKLNNMTRLTLLRLDAEIRACRYQTLLKQQELNLLTEQSEKWKSKYGAVLAKFLVKHGVDLTQYTFDDESGELSLIVKEK